jgi:hypothetical protein
MTCAISLKLEFQINDLRPVRVEFNRLSPSSQADWQDELIKAKREELFGLAISLLLLHMKVLNTEPSPTSLHKQE